MEKFVNKLSEEVGYFDKNYLRKIQGEMFSCSLNCSTDTSSSQEEYQRCLEKCAQPSMRADKFMQEQMQDMQERFQRCAMSCSDKVKDSTSYGEKTPDEKQRIHAEMENCVNKCGDEMIKILPTYTKKMSEWFKKGYYLQ